MFDVGIGEMALLAVLAVVIFGPEQLPKVASQAGRVLRQLRTMASGAKQDLQDGLGPEFSNFDIDDLNPRRFVRKHLLEDFEGDFRRDLDDDDDPPLLDYGERPPYDSEAT